MDAAFDIAILSRLGIAAVSGAVLGVHLDLRDRPGGLRAHSLAAMGAALFCSSARGISSEAGDIIRVIQGISSGVGFIGAATVLRRGTGTVQGVASAASIWIAAAVGCAAALGDWRIPVSVSVCVAILNALSFFAERAWEKNRRDDASQPAQLREAELGHEDE